MNLEGEFDAEQQDAFTFTQSDDAPLVSLKTTKSSSSSNVRGTEILTQIEEPDILTQPHSQEEMGILATVSNFFNQPHLQPQVQEPPPIAVTTPLNTVRVQMKSPSELIKEITRKNDEELLFFASKPNSPVHPLKYVKGTGEESQTEGDMTAVAQQFRDYEKASLRKQSDDALAKMVNGVELANKADDEESIADYDSSSSRSVHLTPEEEEDKQQKLFLTRNLNDDARFSLCTSRNWEKIQRKKKQELSKQTYLNFAGGVPSPYNQLGRFTQDVRPPPRPVEKSKNIARDDKKREDQSGKKKKSKPKETRGHLHDSRLTSPIFGLGLPTPIPLASESSKNKAKDNPITVTVEKGTKQNPSLKPSSGLGLQTPIPLASESSKRIVPLEKASKPNPSLKPSATKKPTPQREDLITIGTKEKEWMPEGSDLIELLSSEDDDDVNGMKEVSREKRKKKSNSKSKKKPASKKKRKRDRSQTTRSRRERSETTHTHREPSETTRTHTNNTDVIYAEYERRMKDEELDGWEWVDIDDYYNDAKKLKEKTKRIKERNAILPKKKAIVRGKSHIYSKDTDPTYDEKRLKRLEERKKKVEMAKTHGKPPPSKKKVSFQTDLDLCETARCHTGGMIMEPIDDIHSISHPLVKDYIRSTRIARRCTWYRLGKPKISWPFIEADDPDKVAPEVDEDDDDGRGHLTMLDHEDFNKIQLVFRERRLGEEELVNVGFYTYLTLERKARELLFS